MRLTPRFTIIWVMALTIMAAAAAVVVRQSYLGSQWAAAVTIILLYLGMVMVAFALTFLAAYSLAWATRTLNPPKTPENPFVVEGQYPPQMVPQQPYGESDL